MGFFILFSIPNLTFFCNLLKHIKMDVYCGMKQPYFINYIFLFILLHGYSVTLIGQCYSVYRDFNNFVHVFDGDQTRFLESQPVTQYQVGKNLVAYIGPNYRTKIFYGGKSYTLADQQAPYYVTDYHFVFRNFNQIKVLRRNDFYLLEGFFRPDEDSLWVSDSLVVWTNFRNEVQVYYNDSTFMLDQFGSNRLKISDNILAYIDRNGNFNAFYHGQFVNLENFEPANFWVDRDLIVYVDQIGNYKFYCEGKWIESNYMLMTRNYIGEQFFCWINNLNELVVFYKGDFVTLLRDLPKKLWVKENIIAFVDKGGNFRSFYKGKEYWLERYQPETVSMDNDIIVYTDLYSRLQGFYYGEQLEISDQIVKKFTLQNEAVSYSLQPYQTKIWCRKKTYTFE